MDNVYRTTKKTVKFGSGLAILIPQDAIRSLGISLGSLLEIEIKNTGMIGVKIDRTKKIVSGAEVADDGKVEQVEPDEE